MPRARPVLPETPYATCRRTTRRTFLMRPDPDGAMQRIVMYLLAVISRQEAVAIHAVIVMSTHIHLVLTDRRGRLPIFFHRLHLALAMCTKSHRGWDEEVWNKSQTSRVDFETDVSFTEAMVYTITNCVKAGMVRSPQRYPGVVSLPEEIGTRVWRLERPDIPWLADEAIWPETEEFMFEMPDHLLAEHGLEGAQIALREAVDATCEQVRAERALEGLGFQGPKACLRTPIETRSTRAEEERSRNPTFAVGPEGRSAFFVAVERMRAWGAAYDSCLERWRSGDRDVVWPAGTWKMVVVHGASAEEPERQLE